MSAAELPSYIVIEGPIGVGKTSLARRLSESLKSDLVLEKPEENPFLPRFYENPRSAALPTQLHFLFQRARQVQEMRQADLFGSVRVSDFMLAKDRLFARLNLDQDEYELYEMVYEKCAMDAPQPDLVVYLQAPADILLERVVRRGNDYEQSMEHEYLARLAEAYARFFHDYDQSPLLIVNAVAIDPVHNEEDYQQLFERIRSVRRGRHYFNPGGADVFG